MPTAAPHPAHGYTTEATRFVAFARRDTTWKRGFTPGHGHKPRARPVTARHHARLRDAIARAKRRLGLPETAPVVSCEAAGREGFWLHRFLQAHGITNEGGDSSSIEVTRRRRRAKSDGLDVRKLVRLLRRSAQGERQGWQVVKVSAVQAAAPRHRHRDLDTLQQERARTTTRLQGLRRSQGIRLPSRRPVPAQLEARRLWAGSPMPPGRRRRVLRVEAHHTVLSAPRAEGEAERRAQLQASSEASLNKVRQLMQLTGIGSNGAWGVVMALLGGRAGTPRREVGGVAGFTPTPSHSGERAREHGMPQASNWPVRWMTTELAWRWRRLQPDRALRVWFRERFGGGGTRWRRLGMVAVARKLLMARWRFRETGGVPAGAALKEA